MTHPVQVKRHLPSFSTYSKTLHNTRSCLRFEANKLQPSETSTFRNKNQPTPLVNQTKRERKKIHSAEAYNNPCVVLNGQVIAMQQKTDDEGTWGRRGLAKGTVKVWM